MPNAVRTIFTRAGPAVIWVGEKVTVTKGSVVTINFGPFSGLSGVVISSSPERTVVRLILQGRSIPIELDTDMIRKPAREWMQRPVEYGPRSRPA